jgi:bacillithiol biosynthesis cysteine-adding enzyme BshC
VGRAFSNSYLAGEPAAHAFFAPVFREPELRIDRARNAAKRGIAPALVRALRDQQAEWGASAARQANLEALASGHAAVVVTGQQVGLFLGPLYAFYKAASAIAIARALEKESGVRCVPVFWLQSEDHDFEEIRSCNVAGTEGAPVVLSLPDPLDGQGRASVANRILPTDVTSLLGDLAQHLPAGPAADETLAFLRTYYRPGVGIVASFAGALASIFSEEGLLLLNPRDARIAELATPIYRRCLEDCGTIEQLLHERSQALAAAGFAEQVSVREDGALVFFHREAVTGPRVRLLQAQKGRAGQAGTTGTDWLLAGSHDTVPAAEVDRLLAHEPLRFSTSALLRPIVQDTLLPTVGYVGGPGEINYFAQVQPLYAHFGLQPPLLLPRARFRLLDVPTRRRLAQLHLSANDVCLPSDQLLSRMAGTEATTSPAHLRETVERQILPAVDALVTTVGAEADPGLQKLAKRTRERVVYRLDRLLARYARVLAEKDTTAMQRLQRLQWTLCPKGIPQERFYGWPWLAAQLGISAARRLVLDHLAAHGPFVTDLQDLEP